MIAIPEHMITLLPQHYTARDIEVVDKLSKYEVMGKGEDFFSHN